MRSLMFPHVKLIATVWALAAGVPALAAPPVKTTIPATVNDDTRVGAPAVIVAPPTVVPPKKVAAPLLTIQPTPVVAVKALPVLAAVPPSALPPKPIPPKASSPQTAPVQIVAPLPPRPLPPRAVTLPQQAMAPQAPSPAPAMLPQSASLAVVQGGASYHRPEYGYQIPAEWTAPQNFISDFDSYDLPRPAAGFGWSRYYDDAVLTDQWGRVYDWREDVNWADHDPRYAGNRNVREDGNRSDRKSRGKRYDYDGRWTGSWDGGPVQTYQGEWRGTVRPHWSGGYDGGNRGGNYSQSYAASYGYDAGGTTVTTIIIQAAPVMTTQTISYDEVSYVPVRAKAVRRWKPRPKPVCACGS